MERGPAIQGKAVSQSRKSQDVEVRSGADLGRATNLIESAAQVLDGKVSRKQARNAQSAINRTENISGTQHTGHIGAFRDK